MVETRVSHPCPNTAVYRKHVDRRVYIVTTHFSCRFVIIFDCFNVSNRPQKTHTTTIRASVDYRLTIHVLVYIIGVNFSAREFTTGVLEIKRGRSLQMEKQVTAQQRCTHHTHIPRLFQAPPTYLAFLTQKLSVCILISNVECVWGFSDEWRAPFVAITKEHTRQVRSSLWCCLGRRLFDPAAATKNSPKKKGRRNRQLRPSIVTCCWQARRLAAHHRNSTCIRKTTAANSTEI